ncbi:hypothetical protein MOQ72_19880 [Saccharopolyspora sp. K220]|uniref:hypothetical protein n=1 Tax=Saccharopolyspora soli TaxID=2926618 RepID=UPI001F5741CE|nr:hypothetical protein [Saccharopolyspora soli]MCI2419709.1 hypothetical protein [Saccharopolyspora soli]
MAAMVGRLFYQPASGGIPPICTTVTALRGTVLTASVTITHLQYGDGCWREGRMFADPWKRGERQGVPLVTV